MANPQQARIILSNKERLQAQASADAMHRLIDEVKEAQPAPKKKPSRHENIPKDLADFIKQQFKMNNWPIAEDHYLYWSVFDKSEDGDLLLLHYHDPITVLTAKRNNPDDPNGKASDLRTINVLSKSKDVWDASRGKDSGGQQPRKNDKFNNRYNKNDKPAEVPASVRRLTMIRGVLVAVDDTQQGIKKYSIVDWSFGADMELEVDNIIDNGPSFTAHDKVLTVGTVQGKDKGKLIIEKVSDIRANPRNFPSDPLNPSSGAKIGDDKKVNTGFRPNEFVIRPGIPGIHIRIFRHNGKVYFSSLRSLKAETGSFFYQDLNSAHKPSTYMTEFVRVLNKRREVLQKNVEYLGKIYKQFDMDGKTFTNEGRHFTGMLRSYEAELAEHDKALSPRILDNDGNVDLSKWINRYIDHDHVYSFLLSSQDFTAGTPVHEEAVYHIMTTPKENLGDLQAATDYERKFVGVTPKPSLTVDEANNILSGTFPFSKVDDVFEDRSQYGCAFVPRWKSGYQQPDDINIDMIWARSTLPQCSYIVLEPKSRKGAWLRGSIVEIHPIEFNKRYMVTRSENNLMASFLAFTEQVWRHTAKDHVQDFVSRMSTDGYYKKVDMLQWNKQASLELAASWFTKSLNENQFVDKESLLSSYEKKIAAVLYFIKYMEDEDEPLLRQIEDKAFADSDGDSKKATVIKERIISSKTVDEFRSLNRKSGEIFHAIYTKINRGNNHPDKHMFLDKFRRQYDYRVAYYHIMCKKWLRYTRHEYQPEDDEKDEEYMEYRRKSNIQPKHESLLKSCEDARPSPDAIYAAVASVKDAMPDEEKDKLDVSVDDVLTYLFEVTGHAGQYNMFRTVDRIYKKIGVPEGLKVMWSIIDEESKQ